MKTTFHDVVIELLLNIRLQRFFLYWIPWICECSADVQSADFKLRLSPLPCCAQGPTCILQCTSFWDQLVLTGVLLLGLVCRLYVIYNQSFLFCQFHLVHKLTVTKKSPVRLMKQSIGGWCACVNGGCMLWENELDTEQHKQPIVYVQLDTLLSICRQAACLIMLWKKLGDTDNPELELKTLRVYDNFIMLSAQFEYM